MNTVGAVRSYHVDKEILPVGCIVKFRDTYRSSLSGIHDCALCLLRPGFYCNLIFAIFLGVDSFPLCKVDYLKVISLSVRVCYLCGMCVCMCACHGIVPTLSANRIG